jgi:hypothetical protein
MNVDGNVYDIYDDSHHFDHDSSDVGSKQNNDYASPDHVVQQENVYSQLT